MGEMEEQGGIPTAPTGIGRKYCPHFVRWGKLCKSCDRRARLLKTNDVLTEQEGSIMPKPLAKGFVILQQNVGYGLPNELFMKQNHRVPFDTLPEAEDNAKDLARANPGVRFYVAEIAVAVEVDERPVNMVVLR